MTRPMPPITAWSPRRLARRRALALAREQADAARDRGDPDLERLFEKLARELRPLVEEEDGVGGPSKTERSPAAVPASPPSHTAAKVKP